jgi:DNA-binding NarL/FixJ family response regulator
MRAAMNRALSRREEQVLRLMAWGHTHNHIASSLGITVKTIESHRNTGLRKLRCANRAELMRYAVREGWLGTDDVSFPFSLPSPTAVCDDWDYDGP